MKNNDKLYSIPKFNNIEEEDKFWKSHSPLMEGHRGKVQKKAQNRASFLSIRLTDKELALLREQAISCSLSPSTYARQIIIQKLESSIDFSSVDLANVLSGWVESSSDEETAEQRKKYLQELYILYKNYLKTVKDMQRIFPFLANVEQMIEKK
jgi:hypothetical protein